MMVDLGRHIWVTFNAAFPQKDARSKTGQESVECRTFPAPPGWKISDYSRGLRIHLARW